MRRANRTLHEGEEEQRTILVLKTRPAGVVAATCVAGKGRADPRAPTWLIDQLMRLGVGQVILQADGEQAQRTYLKDVIEEAAKQSNIWGCKGPLPGLRSQGQRPSRKGHTRGKASGQSPARRAER